MRLYFVKKFIHNLKKSIRKRVRPDFTKCFQFLNDKAYYPEATIPQNFSSKMKLRFFMVIEYFLPVISLNNKCVLLFNILEMFFSIYYFIIIPLSCGFSLDFTVFIFGNFNSKLIKIISLVVIFVDLLVPFNLELINDNGDIIRERRYIAKKYWTEGFCINLMGLSYIVLSLFEKEINANFYFIVFGTLFLFRIKKFHFQLRKIVLFLDINAEKQNFLSYLLFLLANLFILHIFSCIWIYFGNNSFGEEKTWLSESNVLWNFKNQYISSFYYISLFMITNGSSDVKPQNDNEKLCSIFLFFIAFIIITMNIGKIYEILYNISFKDNIKEKINTANFPCFEKIPFVSKLQIISYLSNLEKQNILFSNNKNNDEIIKELPDEMQKNYLENKIIPLLRSKNYLKQNFSETFLKKIALRFTKFLYKSGAIIYNKEKSKNMPMLFLIENGEVEVYLETSAKNAVPIKTLKLGDIFGLASLFSANNYSYSFKAKTLTSIYSINKDVFLQLLKENEENYEAFCYLKDSNHPEFACHFCNNSMDHEIINCPQINFIPNKKPDFSLTFQSFPQKQMRVCFKRKKIKNLNALKHSQLIKEKISNFMISSSSEEIISNYTSSSSSKKYFEEDHLLIAAKVDQKPQSSSTFLDNSDFNENSLQLDSSVDYSNTSLGMRVRNNKRIEKLKSKSLIVLDTKKRNSLSENKSKTESSTRLSRKMIFPTTKLPKIFEENEERESLNKSSDKSDNNSSKSVSVHTVILKNNESKEEILFEKCHEFIKYFPKYNLSNVSKDIQIKNEINKNKKENFSFLEMKKKPCFISMKRKKFINLNKFAKK